MNRINLKPNDELLDKVNRYSEELGMSKAMFCEASTMLLLELIEQGEIEVSKLVELERKRGRKKAV